MRENRLKIAIQRSGRLSEASVGLLKRCDISFENGLGKLRSVADNFPLEILFLRDDDIPRCVEDGVADVGIVGENVLAETCPGTDVIEKLGFGKCRLSIAVPRSFEYSSIADLAGKRIATGYPRILEKYLAEQKVAAEIHPISGSVEIAPGIGLADAVCDLVGSGNTLFTNGLAEVETVMNCEAVLIAGRSVTDEARSLIDRLVFRMRAVNAAASNRYILLNAPNDRLGSIIGLLPGIKSPTIVPLHEKNWSSVHSVIRKAELWETVEQLKANGAEGILVLSIDQMIG